MKFTPRSAIEEFGCANCSEPVYVGDQGYQDPESENCYCGKACAAQHAERPLPLGGSS